MYDQQEIDQRIVIIKHSDLDDVAILDRNYTILMRESSNPEDQRQFETLQKVTRLRIKELTGNERDKS
jgi:hypothetical protein